VNQPERQRPLSTLFRRSSIAVELSMVDSRQHARGLGCSKFVFPGNERTRGVSCLP
jgi:hypothetical protein